MATITINRNVFVLAALLISILGLAGIALADPPSPPPPPPSPPGSGTNINIQDLSAFQACGVGYQGDTSNELEYCDRPYRVTAASQIVYCESDSGLPEGDWVDPKHNYYETTTYHGCDEFGTYTETQTYLSCGNPREILQGDTGGDEMNHEIKEYLIGGDGYSSKNGHNVTGDPREDDPGPTLTDDILNDFDESSPHYKDLTLDNPGNWACKGGAALSDRHSRGEMEVASAVSKSTPGDGTSNQLYVDNEEINVTLNTVIPACVNRIPMMRLKAEIVPGEGSSWDPDSTSETRGLFAKHESVGYGANSNVNNVNNLEFPDQESFKRNYEMGYDLRSYRAWAWRERFPEAVDKAVNRISNTKDHMYFELDSGVRVKGDINNYIWVQSMANDIANNYVSPYGATVNTSSNYENVFYSNDFIFGANTVNESEATSGQTQPSTTTRWSKRCEINMGDEEPSDFAGGDTLDDFNESVNYGSPSDSTLNEFNGTMAEYCGIPNSRNEILDLSKVEWSEEQNPSNSEDENTLIPDPEETHEVKVDLTEMNKLGTINETNDDLINVTDFTWDNAGDFVDYLDYSDQKSKVRPKLDPNEGDVSYECNTSDCSDFSIDDITENSGSNVNVEYSYTHNHQDSTTETKNVAVGDLGSYDNASEMDDDLTDSEQKDEIASVDTDTSNSNDISNIGWDNPESTEITYDVTYTVDDSERLDESQNVDVTNIGWSSGSEFLTLLNEAGRINELEDQVTAQFSIVSVYDINDISASGDNVDVEFDYKTRDPERWDNSDVSDRLEAHVNFTTSKATGGENFTDKAEDRGITVFHEESLPDDVDEFDDLASLESLESAGAYSSGSGGLNLTVVASNWTKAEHGYLGVVYSKNESLKQTWSWRAVENVRMGDMATCLYYWEDCFEQERTFDGSDGNSKTHLLYDTGFGPWKGSWSFNWSDNQTEDSVGELENEITGGGEYTAQATEDLSDLWSVSYSKQFDGAHSHINQSQFPTNTIFSFRECGSGDGWLNKNEPGGIYGQHEYICPDDDHANFKYNSSEESVYNADDGYTASLETVYRCERNPPSTPQNYYVNRSSEYESRIANGQKYICRNYTGEYAQWYEAGEPELSLDSNPSDTGMRVDLVCDNQAPNGCNNRSYKIKLYEPGNQPDQCPTDPDDYDIDSNSTKLSTNKYVCGMVKDFQENVITTSQSIAFSNERLGVRFVYPNDQITIANGQSGVVMMEVLNYDDETINLAQEPSVSGLNGEASLGGTMDATLEESGMEGEVTIDTDGLDTGTYTLEGSATDAETGQSATDTLQVRVVSGKAVEQGVPGIGIVQIMLISVLASLFFVLRA